jgi:hypothetical protein
MTSNLSILAIVIGWLIVILIGVIGAVIIWKMFSGKIDLSTILNDSANGGKASLSRLQFLIFTFVIALSLFLITVGNCDGKNCPKFPDIPNGIFALLGISAATYAVSKGVDANKDVGVAQANATSNVALANTAQANAAQEKAAATAALANAALVNAAAAQK